MAIKDLIESLDKDSNKESEFSDLESAFFDVFQSITNVLNAFLITPLNEDVKNFINEYKVIIHSYSEMIRKYNNILTANENEYNDNGFISVIDTYSKFLYAAYDIAIKNINSEDTQKINDMISAYQVLLRFFNNMLLSHSNYKGKLVNVEKSLTLNIEVIDVEKFLADYILRA